MTAALRAVRLWYLADGKDIVLRSLTGTLSRQTWLNRRSQRSLLVSGH